MSKLKIAVIGAGSISDCHLQAYASNSEVEIYAICDLNEGRAQEMAKKYKASKVFTDYKELLALPEIHRSAFVRGIIRMPKLALPPWMLAKTFCVKSRSAKPSRKRSKWRRRCIVVESSCK